MKKTWNSWLIGSVGAVFILAGCQTAKIQTDTDRNPAFAKHKPDSNTVDNPGADSNVGNPAPTPTQDNGDSNQQGTYTPVAPPDTSGNDNSQPQPVYNPPTQSELVRMTTINGVENTNHGSSIDVHPGDVIAISADVFNSSGGGFSPETRSVEEFSWSATHDGITEYCNAADAGDCLTQSHFQVSDYGVNYYVPYNAGSQISISVSNNNSSNAGSDAILLYNRVPITVAPVIVARAEAYPCGEFNEDCALQGQGRWVYIDGRRHFVPYVNDAAWAPYSHGYWTWVDGDGWTWVSYDQWGWYTDHYGYWRHHGVYGWIWSPFDDRVYRPAVVTWYTDDGHVGWYPRYDHDGWASNHPYWGEEHGFDDGYWGDHRDGDWYGRYHPGFYHVEYRDFGQRDVWGHRANDIDGGEMYRHSYDNHAYGEWPGRQDRDGSREYMHEHGQDVMVTRVDEHQFGGTSVRAPVAVRAVPAQYQNVPAQDQRFGNHPIPVGAVVAHTGGRDQVTPPTSNGKGISAPPFVKDPHTGAAVALPPATQHPAQPNPSNPVFHRPEVPTQPGKIQPITTPVVQPTTPVTHPTVPVTHPTTQPTHTAPPVPPHPTQAPTHTQPPQNNGNEGGNHNGNGNGNENNHGGNGNQNGHGGEKPTPGGKPTPREPSSVDDTTTQDQ